MPYMILSARGVSGGSGEDILRIDLPDHDPFVLVRRLVGRDVTTDLTRIDLAFGSGNGRWPIYSAAPGAAARTVDTTGLTPIPSTYALFCVFTGATSGDELEFMAFVETGS